MTRLLLAFVLSAGCLSAETAVRSLPSPAEASPDSVRSERVQLDVDGDTLHATLLFPPGAAPHPALLIHPGSGPTDRDGNSAALPCKNNSLRLLAEALAERGVATLRIDKRGVGESASALTSEADLRFDDYGEDAAAWLSVLEVDDRFDSVVAGGAPRGLTSRSSRG